MRIAPLPPPGFNSNDTIFASPGLWERGDNVRFFQGKPQALGKERAASMGYAHIRKMLAYNISGTLYLALAGLDNLYKLNLNTNAATDITPASGWTTARAYSLDMYGDILLAAPLDGKLFKSVSGAQAAEITNAPDNITKLLVTPSRQVMALGANEEISGTFNRRCIRWCDIEDFDDWTTSSANNAGEYILSGQEDIITGCMLGQYIVIWTTGSLWLGQYLGNPGQTYLFTRIDGIGAAAHGSYAIYKGVVYWMDPGLAVWQYAPGAPPARIPCQISNELIGVR